MPNSARKKNRNAKVGEKPAIIAVLLRPETKGKKLTADLEVIKGSAQPA